MCYQAEFQLNPIALAELSEFCIVEVSSIVGNEGSWDSEPSDDVLPNKAFDLSFSDICKRLDFNPFCEILYLDDKEPLLS